MRMIHLSLGLAVFVAGCVRPSSPPPVPVENDRTIVFPQFFDRSPLQVSTGGNLYDLDGTTLQAIMIAANDRFAGSTQEQPCIDKRESHRYRVIRQEDIIFVRIDEDLDFCGLDYVISLDSGVEYAISTDGRILRRIFDGDPMDDLSPAQGVTQSMPPPPEPAQQQDGGAGPPSSGASPAPTSSPDSGEAL